MGILVYLSLWVLPDLCHQPYPWCKEPGTEGSQAARRSESSAGSSFCMPL